MTKNTLVENQWTLWSHKPYKDFPSVWYFWIDPENIIRFGRSIESLGFLKVDLKIDLWEGKKISSSEMKKMGCNKVNTKMTQEQLSLGWLIR